MFERERLEAIITEYQKSVIQSEAEIRSKLIVPLLEFLQYPSELRAEEFPVYGFEGGRTLPAKNADFIMFSDKEFGMHRTRTHTNIEWVQNHSLLIIEAKKPGEMPDTMGQPAFYTMWTKAIAYLVSDGRTIKGYYYNQIAADLQVIECEVSKLAEYEDIWNFSYENILQIKESAPPYTQALDANKLQKVRKSAEDCILLTSDEDLNLPESTYAYMQHALGKNAEGLGPLALVSKYLHMTDAFLQNQMRYDIPAYMMDIPRHRYDAALYTDKQIFPLIKGTVIEFYWNEYECYKFESEYITINLLYIDDKLACFNFGYQVLNRYVSERLSNFILVRKFLDADIIHIEINDTERKSLIFPFDNSACPIEASPDKNTMVSLTNYWIHGLERMREIEKYYGFDFNLEPVETSEKLDEIYGVVDLVYAGIVMEHNCDIPLRRSDLNEDIEFSEPTMYEENSQIQLEAKKIFGVTFKPYRMTILPCKIQITKHLKDDIIKLPACCLYEKEQTS